MDFPLESFNKLILLKSDLKLQNNFLIVICMLLFIADNFLVKHFFFSGNLYENESDCLLTSTGFLLEVMKFSRIRK